MVSHEAQTQTWPNELIVWDSWLPFQLHQFSHHKYSNSVNGVKYLSLVFFLSECDQYYHSYSVVHYFDNLECL